MDLVKIRHWAIENWQTLLVSVATLIMISIAIPLNVRFWEQNTKDSDIYYSWVEGGRIANGENPYERILSGNMQENQKYATYFPLFYELSYFTQIIGYKNYNDWIGLWRYFFLAFNLLIGLLLLAITYQKKIWGFGLFVVAFWLFNRWTIHSSFHAVPDFIPIFGLLLSLALFKRKRVLSLLLFSFSLAFKQIAIFVAPLYLIWTFHDTRSLKQTVISGVLIGSIPLLTSIPFLIWNLEGFIRSILFSATRIPMAHLGVDSLDTILNLTGLQARIPMFFLMALVYLVSWQRTLGIYSDAMFAMLIFVTFNSIFFAHYPVWLMPLLPLSAFEWYDRSLANQVTDKTTIDKPSLNT